ncbi:hypothetical protein SAMN03159390_00344 [Pseudomonas sp. NFACC49-2]|nr:hypothetical protein SAMN03159390_00344 [Pseudomonas sp. NFACC49-2]
MQNTRVGASLFAKRLLKPLNLLAFERKFFSRRASKPLCFRISLSPVN